MAFFRTAPGLCALAMLATTFLSGCVSLPPPLYHWGDYQSQVYSHFKGEKGPQDQILGLEEVREKAGAQGKALPPGFRAHLGMLYGETGRTDLFKENLEAEKNQFPESAAFMDFLLKKFTPAPP